MKRSIPENFQREKFSGQVPTESSHPGGSEYVWQRGLEGVSGRVTGGRSLPYFPKKKKQNLAVKKNVSPTIFEFELPNVNHLEP